MRKDEKISPEIKTNVGKSTGDETEKNWQGWKLMRIEVCYYPCGSLTTKSH